MDLSIIIVNWNSKDYLRQCLVSIQRHSPAFSYELIVVESGSFDGCSEMLSREFPEVHFIQSQTNLGFARANNLGAQRASGRFLLFLNPDTEIVGDALEKLLAALEWHSEAGVAGARLLNSDGSLQSTCIQSFPTLCNQVLDAEWLRRMFPRSRLWGIAPLYEPALNPAPVEVISGACFLIRRSVFEKLSGFDQRFFMYSEDLDLCHRVRKAGGACLYVPDATVVHHGGGSSKSARSTFSVVMMRESVHRLFKIHRGRLVAFGYRVAMGISALGRLPLVLGGMAFRKISGGSASPASLKKWLAILRWSLGLEPWAARQSGGGETRPPAQDVSGNCQIASVRGLDCQ